MTPLNLPVWVALIYSYFHIKVKTSAELESNLLSKQNNGVTVQVYFDVSTITDTLPCVWSFYSAH